MICSSSAASLLLLVDFVGGVSLLLQVFKPLHMVKYLLWLIAHQRKNLKLCPDAFKYLVMVQTIQSEMKSETW